MKVARWLGLGCWLWVACGSDGEPVPAGGAAAVSGGAGAVAAGQAAAGGGASAAVGGARARAGGAGAASGAGARPAAAGGGGTAARAGAGGGSSTSTSTSTSTSGDAAEIAGWRLVWRDEFDGAKGQKLDAGRWVYETGGSGWGNNQLEFDTDRAENASLDGAGQLVITAIKESYMGKGYTSVRLKTQGKFEHAYGRYEARMQLPFGQGIWPAFWLLGVDPDNAGWPARGELDIMENIGREPDTIHGTLHGPGYSGGNGVGAASKLAAGARYADDYHVFAVEWEKEVVRWYVDGKLYQARTPGDLPSGTKWVYDHPFFLLLNLAVGGQWPGNPDNTTTFPQTMRVDYVRVYERP